MPTPKQRVRSIDPRATSDYSEYMLGAGKPAYFIRHGLQGLPLHDRLYRSPTAAWKAAQESLQHATLDTILAAQQRRLEALNAAMDPSRRVAA